MENNRPDSREQNVKEGKGAGIKRRGEGLNSGPVGNRTEQFIKEHYSNAAKEKSAKNDDPQPGAANRAGGQAGPGNPKGSAPHGQAPNKNAPHSGQASAQNKGLLDELGNMLGGTESGSGSASNLGGLFGTGTSSNSSQTTSGGSGGSGTGGGLNFSSSGSSGSGSSGGGKRGISIVAIIVIIVIIIFLFRGSCSGTSNTTTTGSSSSSSSLLDQLSGNSSSSSYNSSSLLNGYDYDDYYNNYNYSTYSNSSYGYDDYSSSYGSYGSDGYDMSSIFGSLLGGSGAGSYGNYGGYSNSLFGNVSSVNWDANTGVLNTAVANGTPAKRTTIKGSGNDVVTLMVYICGSDLESGSGAATMDIQEMLAATTNNENLNIILYTGGATQWQNNVMSASTNQIYQIRGGQLYRLENDMGRKAMTDPNTLTEFIKYCDTNFPANRNMLILWDHGGGSVSGYAYDEVFKTSGYMSLAGINKALKNAGVTFDMIGFDTCLMATVENALMLSNYSDYLVASEEVEPSTGWYYTDWLTKLNNNTSIATTELGKSIVDSFISSCGSVAYGLGSTLSVIDLAELSYTVPEKLAAFSNDVSDMIDSGENGGTYTSVVNARTGSREFGETESLDQIDLIDFANKIGTDSATALTDALKSAIKYNQVTSSMSNSYGLSVFFPYTRTSYVNKASDIYDEIGMTSEYISCIRKFATLQGNGQSIFGSSSGYGSLFDALQGSNSYSTDAYSSGDISDLFSTLFSTSGYGRELDMDAASEFLSENRFDASKLVWTDGDDGQKVINLSEKQWSLVNSITLNAFYDDGEGYIDLGADNYFELDDEGNLIGSYNGTWLAIDDNIVAYYFDSMTYDDDDYTIEGHVPVLYNGTRANLIIIFDSSNPKGYIAGLNIMYDNDDEIMASKTLHKLEEGAAIDFIADYYTYEGKYENSYMIGDQWSYTDGAEIANVPVGEGVLALYQFTDIYGNNFWTPAIP